MNRIKKIFLVFFIVFLAIQFVRPSHNKNSQASSAGITESLYLPAGVLATLKTGCYDCHSNNANYPWYSNIQPIGWLQSVHITEGKHELNFDEFNSYSTRRKISKLKSIYYQVDEDKMPLASYTLLHKEAKLSQKQKEELLLWVNKTLDSLTTE